MARQDHTPAILPAGYSGEAIAFAWLAGDVVNGDQFPITGNEMLLASNTGASPYTVTIDEVDCAHGRSATVVISIPAGELRAFPIYPRDGFSNSGQLHVNVENVAVELAVIKIK